MPYPLVDQLRFTRSGVRRAASGISAEDARKRVAPMNSVSWTIGHLVRQEQRYFLYFPTGEYLIPQIQERYAFGSPHSTPRAAQDVGCVAQDTKAADAWLDTLPPKKLQARVRLDGKLTDRVYGNLLQRVITGENMAVHKIMGHTGIGPFVGDIDNKAPYRPR